MIIIINSLLTNSSSIKILNNLNKNTYKLSASLQRMASGLKINQAKDDAAGCVISSKAKVDLSGLNVANKNAMQGISMLNIADDALKNMSDKTIRIRDIALKAMNSTYSNDELNALQNEIDELIAEIKREKDAAIYNQKKIFEPTIDVTEVVPPPEKPYAYEVEYLESTGTQWIDTGITGNQDTGFDIVYKTNNNISTNSYGSIFGARKSSQQAELQLTTYNQGGSGTLRYGTNGSFAAGIEKNEINHSTLMNKVYTDNETVNIDVSSKGNYTTPCNITVFALNENGKAIQHGKLKLYSFKLYDGNTLVRDFIPVIDKDGKACLYDKVSGQMLYNKGSGDFLTGDIIPPEEPEFITTAIKNTTTLQISQDGGENSSITLDLGFNLDLLTANVKSQGGAKAAIQKCDDLISTLNLRRSQVGSSLNRIDSICELQNKQIQNLSMMKSVITDTDMASESTNLIKNQITQQISTSLFIQAKKMNGNLALNLLKL